MNFDHKYASHISVDLMTTITDLYRAVQQKDNQEVVRNIEKLSSVHIRLGFLIQDMEVQLNGIPPRDE